MWVIPSDGFVVADTDEVLCFWATAEKHEKYIELQLTTRIFHTTQSFINKQATLENHFLFK